MSLRDVYAAADLGHARRHLTGFYQWCPDADLSELTRLANTIPSWQNEVVAHHATGLSSGPTEAVNLLIEKLRGIGHGLLELRQLPAPAPPPMRRHMANSANRMNPSRQLPLIV